MIPKIDKGFELPVSHRPHTTRSSIRIAAILLLAVSFQPGPVVTSNVLSPLRDLLPLFDGRTCAADDLPEESATQSALSVTQARSESSRSASFTFGSRMVFDRCWPQDHPEPGDHGRTDFRISDQPADRKTGLPPNGELSPLPEGLRNSIRGVKPFNNEKVVALTFDLCEAPGEISGYDAAVVNTLRKHDVRATFFAGGKWMQHHPERAMQLMADPLFEIGNHSWDHPNFRKITPAEMKTQILRTQAEYRSLRDELQSRCGAEGVPAEEMSGIPAAPRFFRFPFGTCDKEALDMLAGFGLPAVQWSIVSADPSKSQTAAGIVRTILARIRPGAVIICHANGKGHGTAEAIPLFVPALRKMGYEFVTMSELLTHGTPISSTECYEERPGDNFKYDHWDGAAKHAK